MRMTIPASLDAFDGVTKVLIVDDLPENLQALNALIRASDRLIYQASSGDEALSLLLEHEFALAILDVQMPGMDGFELAQLMRGTEKTRHIPIVFVTAAGRERNYAFQGYEQGAVDFLHKPLDIDAVQSKVNVFVALSQQRAEIRRQVTALERSREEQEALLQELNATQAELQRSLRMRDDFMSMVAHELRTPLNTLFLESQMRKLNLDRGNSAAFEPAQLEKMVARDGRQIRSMVRLIDDMLDVSRMRSGKLSIRPEPTDLALLVQRVVDDLQPHAAAAGSTLDCTASGPIHGVWDAFRLEQIVVNLVGNAVRYGLGRPIAVSLAASQNSALIEVRDQGMGISVADQQRIFAPFERITQQDATGGLGLGLYITQELVHAHGGAITLQSQVGKGALFSVTLPLAGAVPAAPAGT